MFLKGLKSFLSFPPKTFGLRFQSTAQAQTQTQETTKAANIVDGQKLAQNLKSKLKNFIDAQADQTKPKPGIGFLFLNNRDESRLYIKQKTEIFSQLGINFFKYEYPTTIDEETVLKTIDELNQREDVHGIMLELPLPENLIKSTMKIINRIKPSKDVEGITDENMAKVFFGEHSDLTLPCTPAACLHILQEHGITVSGKYCVIPNRSRIVGLPLSKLLLHRNATVTVCNPMKSDIQSIVAKADIIFSAIGQHNAIKSEWIKEGAVVVDIGTNFIEEDGNQKMVGDIVFDEVKDKVELITPVPGGVGPLTVMMLTRNIVEAWAKNYNIPFTLD